MTAKISHFPELHQEIMTFFLDCRRSPDQIGREINLKALSGKFELSDYSVCIFTLEGLYQALQSRCEIARNFGFKEFQQCLYKNPTNLMLSEYGLVVDTCVTDSLDGDRCYQLKPLDTDHEQP